MITVAAYPAVRIIVSVTAWYDLAGQPLTVSRGFGRTMAGQHLDCRILLDQARTRLPEDQPELASWYAESWFAGTGGIKFPRPDAPPAGLADRLAAVLSTLV